MARRKVAVIDYGMGNIWSVLSAFNYLGADAYLVNQPKAIIDADFVVLPGVGSFRKAMVTLSAQGLADAILEAALIKQSKLLGICLGMQLLASSGTEDGETKGLGLIDNKVDLFTHKELNGEKVPHVGFNSVNFNKRIGFFEDLPDQADFYFVHSYKMVLEQFKGNFGTCNYGIDFLAAFEYNNIYGTQFHPEKSQTNGLILLKNFLGT
jgi:glutamine amidotransferase